MLAPIVSKRNPMAESMRVRCSTEQRKRWKRAGVKANVDESAVVRQLMDQWADSVLGPKQDKPPAKP